MGPYRTIQDLMGSYGIIWYHRVPTVSFGNIGDQTGPYGTIKDHTGPYWTIQDHMGPYWAIQDH